MKARTKSGARIDSLERDRDSLITRIGQLERALVAGSVSLDYVAVRNFKDELESSRAELKSVQRKLSQARSA